MNCPVVAFRPTFPRERRPARPCDGLVVRTVRSLSEGDTVPNVRGHGRRQLQIRADEQRQCGM